MDLTGIEFQRSSLVSQPCKSTPVSNARLVLLPERAAAARLPRSAPILPLAMELGRGGQPNHDEDMEFCEPDCVPDIHKDIPQPVSWTDPDVALAASIDAV